MPVNTLRQIQRLALARTLSILRITKDFKREYLAGKIGFSCASIDKLEQGVTNARFADVVIICKALEIDFCEFVCLYEKELLKLCLATIIKI
jgi:transcriptional regulator with XRE-family HTH domain